MRSMQRVMIHAADLDRALVDRLWSYPDEALAAATMLKDGDRCTVTRIDIEKPIAPSPAPSPAPEKPKSKSGRKKSAEDAAEPASEANFAADSFTLKRYNLKGALHTAVHMPMRSRARWSWINGRKLIKAGLPTPMPLACIEDRRHGVLHLRSYLLTQFVPGRTLLDLVESGSAKGERLAELARQFTRIWQTLGQLRAGHGDMKASNFIVDPQGKLWLIDLDGLRIHRSAVLLRRERRNDLARFMRNWSEKPEVAAVFRARIGTG